VTTEQEKRIRKNVIAVLKEIKSANAKNVDRNILGLTTQTYVIFVLDIKKMQKIPIGKT
jgi:hypothetical protein